MLTSNRKYFNQRKRLITFSFLLLLNFFSSQNIIRHSDEKSMDSVVLLQKGNKVVLNRSNFRNFKFNNDDKILYENNILDFYVSEDSLIFFDKVKEIEEIHLDEVNVNEKKEKAFKANKANATAQIFTNNLIATFVNIKTRKRTFVKSIIFYPEISLFPNDVRGKITIKLLLNLNGFPDNTSELLVFDKDISETINKNWEIILPKIVKYPKNGFFVTFFYQSNDKNKTSVLRLNKESKMYMFFPAENQWKKMFNNGYLYKLKVLQ